MQHEDYEPPRYVIQSARINPTVELARWLFERHRIPYEEQAHAPLLHEFFTRRGGGGSEVPVVRTAASMWRGARELLAGLDGRLPEGERLFGETATDRADTRACVDQLLDGLPFAVRRLVCFHLLPLKRVGYPIATEAAPAWERGAVRLLYPLWRRLMERSLDFSPAAIREARTRIGEAFDFVESRLAERGTRFLHGDVPGTCDIVFSALVAPLVLPKGCGSALPALDDLPADLRSFVDPLRSRPAGQLALQTYAAVRPSSQPLLRRPSRNRTWLQILLGPGVQRLGARLAVRVGRPLRVRRFTLVSRWADVHAALQSDLHHRVAPVNGPPFEVISGPFVLGLDRGDQFACERVWMYSAMSRIDTEALRNSVAREASRLLDDAAGLGSAIDVAHGYAHLVAARTARDLFGISGPTEGDLMRVCRALFHYSFLNQSSDPKVEARARRAADELRGWVNAEIARRRAGDLSIDDVLGRLMATPPSGGGAIDDDAVRRIVTGLLVGAIDTTSPTVPRIVSVLASKPEILRRVEQDVGDPIRMAGWCAEALRMWPTAPLLFRRAAPGATVVGRAVKPDSVVAAFTQAAMYDPAVFPEPMALDPTRPRRPYMNFGGGLHPCAGRGVNDVQLPELVSQLVARGIASVGRPRFVGPFLDELVVTFQRTPS